MSCTYSSTLPSQGDEVVVLLKKLVQAWGGTVECHDNEWILVSKLAALVGATPAQGDSLMLLWEKIRRALGDETCRCGNSEWNSIQLVLEALTPGAFSPGDSKYNLLWKLLANNQTPPGPTPPPSGPDLYQLIFFSRMTVAPTDSTTYFLGFTDSFINSYDAVKIPIPVSGTMRRFSAKVQFALTSGSGELVNHFLRVNDSVDVGSLSFAWNANNVSGADLNVNHPVVAGDLVSLKIVTPVWATNPLSNIRIYGSVVIEPS